MMYDVTDILFAFLSVAREMKILMKTLLIS